jgi:hypothetical protein
MYICSVHLYEFARSLTYFGSLSGSAACTYIQTHFQKCSAQFSLLCLIALISLARVSIILPLVSYILHLIDFVRTIQQSVFKHFLFSAKSYINKILRVYFLLFRLFQRMCQNVRT